MPTLLSREKIINFSILSKKKKHHCNIHGFLFFTFLFFSLSSYDYHMYAKYLNFSVYLTSDTTMLEQAFKGFSIIHVGFIREFKLVRVVVVVVVVVIVVAIV
jgi:hypothetical protein